MEDYEICYECEIPTAVLEHRPIDGADQDIDQYIMACPECDNTCAVEFVDGKFKGYVERRKTMSSQVKTEKEYRVFVEIEVDIIESGDFNATKIIASAADIFPGGEIVNHAIYDEHCELLDSTWD